MKYHIKTFGCQMNKNDSERIAGLLDSLGMEQTFDETKADVLLINTCSVRQTAEDRAYGIVRNWQALRDKKPKLVIGVTGCMPGRDKDGKMKNKIKGVDLFFPISDLVRLPRWLKELNPDLIKNDIDELDDYLSVVPSQENKYQAYVTIQTGCNNFCSYCVVPYARGRERNRELKDILKEVKSLAKQGVKEITLLGQVVNNYHTPDRENFSPSNPFQNDFAALLWEINQIEGVKRIHWTAAHPECFNDDQIKALSLPKQANYLHLPVQSGDNEILKKMNRKYMREEYIDLIEKIKDQKPDIALGTDLIVGFCGENERQFANTLDLYRECDFDISYPAMYSVRSNTAAAKAFEDNVSYEEKKRRWREVQDLMEEIAYRKNQKYLNGIVEVLVEKCENGLCCGRSNEMKFVQFSGDQSLVGQIVEVKIFMADVWLLKGKSV